MSDATLARMEHGKYVGVRKESRRDGVCTLKGHTLYPFGLNALENVVVHSQLAGLSSV